MIKDDEYFMNLAYKEAIKAYNKREIPVGAVLVCNNKVLSKAYNLRDSSNIVTKHAEIIAIEKANKKTNNWRLLNTTLYTTLEPCPMCYEVIKAAKINRVVFAAKSDNKLTTNTFSVQINNLDIITNCENIIKDLFKTLR
jgi:tRNA(adenine34) deaminase